MFKWFIVGLLVLGALLYFAGPIILATVLAILAVVFTFGTWPFWFLLAIVTLFIAWCLSEESWDGVSEMWSGTAVASVILFTAIVAFVNKNLLSLKDYSFWTSVGLVAGAFLAYFVLGGLWSAFKYYRFSIYRTERLENRKAEIRATLSIYGLTTEPLIADLLRQEVNHNDPNYKAYELAKNYKVLIRGGFLRAKPSHNIDRISAWIGLWPWSIVATVLRDPVKLIYDLMLNVYNFIYNRTMGKVEAQYKAVFVDDQNEE